MHIWLTWDISFNTHLKDATIPTRFTNTAAFTGSSKVNETSLAVPV
jgi:hypothetical protein